MSASIWSALQERFAAPEWAYFEEVRNGTGYSRGVTRTADAVALSLWPSRGLEMHGIEVKVGRGDWLREKNDPAKAEEIGRYCERWWLATTKGVVVDKSEIPTSWGWLEFDGKKLVQKKQADHQKAQPLSKELIAAILRKASEGQNALVRQAVTAQLDERMAHEREVVEQKQAQLTERLRDAEGESRSMRALLHRLEVLLGEKLFTADYPPKPLEQIPEELRERLALAQQADLAVLHEQLHRAVEALKDVSVRARWDPSRGRGAPSEAARLARCRVSPRFFCADRDDTSLVTSRGAEFSASECAGGAP